MPGSPSDPVEQAWAYLRDRFGIQQDDAVLDGLTLEQVSGDVWLVPEQHESAYAVKTYGIRCVRMQDIGLKPTTYALQLLEPAVSQNVVTVDRTQLQELLAGELVPVDAVDGALDGEGYVGIRYGDRLLGCGLYKNDTVSSRIPKGRGQELARFMEEKKAKR